MTTARGTQNAPIKMLLRMAGDLRPVAGADVAGDRQPVALEEREAFHESPVLFARPRGLLRASFVLALPVQIVRVFCA